MEEEQEEEEGGNNHGWQPLGALPVWESMLSGFMHEYKYMYIHE